MSQYFPTSRAVSRRTVALGGIAGLHVLVVYMFASGLAIKLVPVEVPSIDVTVRDVQRDIPTVPPPPQPTMRDFREVDTSLPPPIDLPPSDGGITLDPRPLVPVAPQHVDPPAPPPVRVLGQNRLPNTEDYYPAAERRLGIEGSAVVRACVDENGTLLQSGPSVEQSSGNAHLDAGALSVARAGHYARSMQGTSPVPNCFRIKIGFQMK